MQVPSVTCKWPRALYMNVRPACGIEYIICLVYLRCLLWPINDLGHCLRMQSPFVTYKWPSTLLGKPFPPVVHVVNCKTCCLVYLCSPHLWPINDLRLCLRALSPPVAQILSPTCGLACVSSLHLGQKCIIFGRLVPAPTRLPSFLGSASARLRAPGAPSSRTREPECVAVLTPTLDFNLSCLKYCDLVMELHFALSDWIRRTFVCVRVLLICICIRILQNEVWRQQKEKK